MAKKTDDDRFLGIGESQCDSRNDPVNLPTPSVHFTPDNATLKTQCNAWPTKSTALYVGHLAILMIPGVGLIIAIIWACQKKNPTRKNLSRAGLILLPVHIIMILLSVTGVIVLGYHLVNSIQY
jgi:hypothetical protein